MADGNAFGIAKEETDKEIVNPLRELLKPDTAVIALLMTYVPAKITPSKSVLGRIGLSEELGIEDAIEAIKEKGIDKIYLLINSFGGDVSSSYIVARAIRINFSEVTTFIPHIAASGGTLIALAGNKFVMGDVSHMSPIDVQMARNGKMFSVNSMIRSFHALNELFSDTADADAPYPWKAMADKLDPVEFQEWVDSAKLMAQHAKEVLKHEKSSLRSRTDSIVEKLTTGYPVHGYSITYEEIRSILGDDVCFKNSCDDYKGIWKIMKKWLRKYIKEESGYHIIRYILPESSTQEGAK